MMNPVSSLLCAEVHKTSSDEGIWNTINFTCKRGYLEIKA